MGIGVDYRRDSVKYMNKYLEIIIIIANFISCASIVEIDSWVRFYFGLDYPPFELLIQKADGISS